MLCLRRHTPISLSRKHLRAELLVLRHVPVVLSFFFFFAFLVLQRTRLEHPPVGADVAPTMWKQQSNRLVATKTSRHFLYLGGNETP